MDNRLNVSIRYPKKVGGYDLKSENLNEIASIPDLEKNDLNYTLLAPIHSYDSWYYFTFDPPLVWKHSSSLVEIDIESVCCFFVMMFLSAATVYLSTRCLRRRIATTTGFGNILWDFVASFFFEPFPSGCGTLSVRLVLAFWLFGITIFCNDINGVFKGKLSVKEYAGVETKEDLDRHECKLQNNSTSEKVYWSSKYGNETMTMFTSLVNFYTDTPFFYISKKAVWDQLCIQVLYIGETEYDARIHETIKNWALRLYEGSTGNTLEGKEIESKLIQGLDSNAQLFTPYEMADLSVPFRLFGYGMAAAIGVKFVETILDIYNNNNKRPKRKPQ